MTIHNVDGMLHLEPHAVAFLSDTSKRWAFRERGVRRFWTGLFHVSGIMTLLFSVMHTPHPHPLPDQFQLSRHWIYTARLVSSTELCRSNISLEILRVAVAVGGRSSLKVWGKQWVKMLHLIEKRVDEAADKTSMIGEASVGGTARRIRVKEEIRKVLEE